MADATPPIAKRNVAVSIGVAETGGFPFLPGAINAARAFYDWADALKYESHLVTDETSPVTFSRVRFEIEAALAGATSPPLKQDDERRVIDAALSRAKPIRRLILFFAGHGLIKEMEQGLWFLSDSIPEQRVVDAERLRRRLYRFGIDQIAIIADACRSLPKTVELADLNPDAILGMGPQIRAAAPPFDKFVATQDGSNSYSIPGESPEEDRALFSSLLVEALWGVRPGALWQPDNKFVTSQSLKNFLTSEVPRVALKYERTLQPDISTNFSGGEDIYFGDVAPKSRAPVFPEWPPANALLGMGDSSDPHNRAVLKERETLARIRAQQRPTSFETSSGFAVAGARIAHVLTEVGIVSGKPGEENQVHIGPSHNQRLEIAMSLLIETEGGLAAAPTAMPGFIGTILMNADGVYALVYRQSPEPLGPEYASEDAIAKLESGALKGDELRNLVVLMRIQKHRDPTLGAISAYVYESLGDLDSIRQMAYYYVTNGQPIPFDIAMLAHLETRKIEGKLLASVPATAAREPQTQFEKQNSWTFQRTDASEGLVGGIWPWMRQGWFLLEDYYDKKSALIDPFLIEVASTIAPARFSTLNKEGAAALAEHFALAERE
jgi:hypothetical protein